MSTFKGLIAVAILTYLFSLGAMELNIAAHHTDPLWALGTAFAFLTLLITDVWMFFAIAQDDPFKWEK